MRIAYLGHACFAIEANEARVVMDPFAADLPHAFPPTAADIVTMSHDHFDHNAVGRVGGRPTPVRGAGIHHAAGVEIVGIASWHDAAGGTQRGPNTLFAFTLEGLRLAHLGDLGTPLDASQRAALRDAHVLFLPVGGHYTLDARTAAAVARSLPGVRLVFPMHFQTRATSEWPIAPVDEFLQTMDNVRHIGSSSVVLTSETLPEALEVWVLDHA